MSGGDGRAVTVIVPACRSDEALRRCAVSLAALSPAADEVVLVADGAEARAQLEPLAAEFGFKLAATPHRRGPGAARNAGAAVAGGDLLLFVDADVAVPPALIEQVRAAMADRSIAAVIGSYDRHPAALNLLSQYKNLLQHHVHQQARHDAFTFWGACGAIRREVFQQLRGFDETCDNPAIEDIELGYRMRAAGHRIRLVPEVQVKHLKRWTAGSLFVSDVFRRAIPWSRLILRAGRLENDLNIGWLSRIKVGLAQMVVLCLIGAAAWSPLAWAALAATATLIALDWPLLRFFIRERGVLFTVAATPWHLFHHWYSGAAFGYVLLSRAWTPSKPAPQQPAHIDTVMTEPAR